jgi:hypothetical protein
MVKKTILDIRTIDYVAYEQIYDITLPVVQKMIESFEITT